MAKMGDFIRSESKEIDLILHELSLMKQLIKERAHSLDLLRELISNACAKEVEATEVKVKYTMGDEGHIFEVDDNGCGMDFTGNKQLPGRLDRFLGLGLSSLVGIKSDEFSWKGLGSKLAFQSKRIEIDTWYGKGKAYRVEINEPWSSLERQLIPRPKVFEYDPETGRDTGTSIKVYGHPPHRKDQPFAVEQIKAYLLHRTFVGFTREREAKPTIMLSVFGKTEALDVGFPELKLTKPKVGTVLVQETNATVKPGTNKTIPIVLKGFYTWDEKDHGLDPNQLNTGLILSVRGIPYCKLDMAEYGSRSLTTANPGQKKCCLIVECDEIQDEMSISRSGLVDSEATDLFRKAVAEIFQKIESSKEHLGFRQVPQERKTQVSAGVLREKKNKLESETQRWVVYQPLESNAPNVLLREPENEMDVLALLWKLEALGALPFAEFRTLGHAGTGPDLIAHFQEDERSHPDRYTSIEVENNFYNYKAHGHRPAQYPRVVCWDIGKTPKMTINKTDKKYKFTADKEDFQVHIFALRLMDGIKVLTRKELRKHGF